MSIVTFVEESQKFEVQTIWRLKFSKLSQDRLLEIPNAVNTLQTSKRYISRSIYMKIEC
jgi:hypothetical protein